MESIIDQNRAKLYAYANGSNFTGKEIGEVFQEIYRERTWDNLEKQESVSGIGSSLAQTQAIVDHLPELIRRFSIQSVLDIPCGDFHWMRQVVPYFSHYTGADIVKDLISTNQQKYGAANIHFLQLNLIKDPLSVYDLIFCRDCLVHFSFRHMMDALQIIKKSQSRYLLTTTFPLQEVNEDIVTGGWRPVNFQQPPFNFPEPLLLINEKCTEMNGAFCDKSLGLWAISDITPIVL